MIVVTFRIIWNITQPKERECTTTALELLRRNYVQGKDLSAYDHRGTIYTLVKLED